MTDEEFIARIRATPTLLSIMLQIDDALEARDKEVAERSARIAELEAALKPFAFREPFQLNLENGESSVMAIAVFENEQASARAALKGEK